MRYLYFQNFLLAILSILLLLSPQDCSASVSGQYTYVNGSNAIFILLRQSKQHLSGYAQIVTPDRYKPHGYNVFRSDISGTAASHSINFKMSATGQTFDGSCAKGKMTIRYATQLGTLNTINLKQSSVKQWNAALSDFESRCEWMKKLIDQYDSARFSASRKEKSLETLKQSIPDEKESLKSATANLEKAQKELTQTEKGLQDAKASLDDARSALKIKEKSLNDAKAELEEMLVDLGRTRDEYYKDSSQDAEARVQDKENKVSEAEDKVSELERIVGDAERAVGDKEREVGYADTELVTAQTRVSDALRDKVTAQEDLSNDQIALGLLPKSLAIDKYEVDLVTNCFISKDVELGVFNIRLSRFTAKGSYFVFEHPSNISKTLALTSAGSQINVALNHSAWYPVMLSDGSLGWIQKSSIASARPYSTRQRSAK